MVRATRLQSVSSTPCRNNERGRLLTQVIEEANLEQLTEQDLQSALKEASLFNAPCFSPFKDVPIFAYGQTQRTEEVN